MSKLVYNVFYDYNRQAILIQGANFGGIYAEYPVIEFSDEYFRLRENDVLTAARNLYNWFGAKINWMV